MAAEAERTEPDQAVAQLIARLQGGETIEGLLRSLIPDAERELLKYCSTVRMFDERLVDAIFRPEVNGGDKKAIAFSQITERSFVAPVAGVEGFYQLRESSRRDYFDLWQQGTDEPVPPALKAVSEKLVSYFRSLGVGWELDVLYQLIAADSTEAAKLFSELYDAADSAFELGRCQDLIKILEERHTILNRNLLELLTAHQYYLKARSLWSKEYYQTVYYYEVTKLQKSLEELLQNPQKWILQLYAPGGRGKTMFLRWLISRRYVPIKTPCARIDFDFIDPVIATQNPWMLFLEIAQQLNEQIPGNLFSEQLGDLKEFRPLLMRAEGSPSDHSQLRALQLRKDLEEIPARFVRALRAARLSNKLILIFDTLEEVILYQGTDMMALLAEVKKLHASYENFCLVLSGRYDLDQKLNGFKNEYGDFAEGLEVGRFSDEDARHYLTERRGITRLVEAVVTKAQGNPFKLALYADILRNNPRVTQRDIQSFPSDLLYLIRRVLLRIPDLRVRWLLRYGVIPRKLRLSFVNDVMAAYLPNAMSGKSAFDDPGKDLDIPMRAENAFQKALKSSAEGVDVDHLWRELNRYASSYSWISPDQEANTLSFHPDVLNPMRRLLRKQKIFRKLHRAAIRYFEKNAKADLDNWGQWIQEAVYHKFQLDAAPARSYWRQQIEHPAAAEKPEWRLSLAREVINLAVQTAAEQEGDAEPEATVVNKELLAQAYFEVARANVEIARSSSADSSRESFWHEANKAYASSEHLSDELKQSVVPAARKAFVRSAILTSQGKRKDAQAVLEAALRLRANSKDKINLELEYATALSLQSKYRKATPHYLAALKLAPKAKIKASKILEIRKELARHYENIGEIKKAIQEYKTGLQFAKRANKYLAGLEFSRRLAEVYLAVGQPAKAHSYAFEKRGAGQWIAPTRYNLRNISTAALAKSPKSRYEIIHFLNLQGRVALALREPLTALQKTVEHRKAVERAIGEGWEGLTSKELYASANEFRGLVSGELMEHSRALDELELARSLWKDAGDTVGADRCLSHMVRIQLRVAGNVKAAKFLSEQVERLNLQAQPESRIQQLLLRVQVLDLLDRAVLSKKQLQRLSALSRQEKWLPVNKAAIAIASLLHRAQRGRTIPIRESVSLLKRIQPPSARLALLDAMQWCPTPKKVPGRLAKAFCETLPNPAWDEKDGPVNAVKMADALRVVGKRLSPRSLIQQAEKRFIADNNLFALREVYQVWDRLGWPNRVVPDLSVQIAAFLKTYKDYQTLCGAMLLEHAERLFKSDQLDSSEEMLGRAESYLTKAIGTQWQARVFELRGRLLIERNLPRHTRGARIDKTQETAVRQGFRSLILAKNLHDSLENRIASKRLARSLAAERKLLEVAVGGKSSKKKRSKTNNVALKSRLRILKPLQLRTYEDYAAQFADAMSHPKDACTVALSRPPGSRNLTTETQLYGRKSHSATWRPADSPFVRSISEVAPGEIFSKEFAKQFSEGWQPLRREMCRLLLEKSMPGILSAKKKIKPDLRLEINDPLLACFPWEFILLSSIIGSGTHRQLIDLFRCMYRSSSEDMTYYWTIRSLQLALHKLYPHLPVDGIYGPLTVQAVRRFQSSHDLPATGIADQSTIERIQSVLREAETNAQVPVLIVQATSQRQMYTSRGHGTGGVSLPSLYSKHGFKVDVVENPSLDWLIDALRGSSAKIIHFCPIMKRSPSVGIYLDFGLESRGGTNLWLSSLIKGGPSRDAGIFSTTGLNKLLEDFTHHNKIRPLVIFDVPRPPVLSEAVTQMMLRNAFASEIYRMGSAAAVLAMGLAEPHEQQKPLINFLVSSLAQKSSLGRIVTEISQMSLPYLDDMNESESASPETLELIMGYVSPALFTQNPTFVIQ